MNLTLLTIILGSFTGLTPLAVDMYLPAMPELGRAFGASPSAVQLTLSTFFIGLGLGQFVYGPLSDRFGRKLPLYIGGALFVGASIGCALVNSIETMVALRFVQALGCAAGLVVPRAMVRDLFAPQHAARVFSMLMLVMGVAPILAPLIGGYVLIWFGWPAIFWVLAIAGAVIAVMAAVTLPETRAPGTVAALSVGHVLRSYLAVLRDRRFVGFTLGGSFAMAGMFAYIAGSPFVIIELFGVPAEAYGWVFGSNAIGFIGTSQINRRLLHHYPADAILRAGAMIGAAAALILVVMVATGSGGIWGVLVPLFFCIAPLGIILPNATALAMAGHGERAGTAAAMLGIIQFASGGFASAAVSALQNGTALPMAAVIAACMAGGIAARLALVR